MNNPPKVVINFLALENVEALSDSSKSVWIIWNGFGSDLFLYNNSSISLV